MALALIIADSAHRDPSTGKNYILGTISVIQASEFPCVIPSFCVYVALTDGYGETMVTVRIIDVDDEQQLNPDVNVPVHFPDPIHVAEIVIFIQGLRFPRAGEYRIQLYGAGQFLTERRLLVERAPEGGRSQTGEQGNGPD